MQPLRNYYLIWAGMASLAAALLHIATIFGGPSWYRLIGATEPIIRMAEKGHSYPAMVCMFSAALLFICAAYAFSGAGMMWKFPLLRTGLVFISAALLFHGIAFIPLVMLQPEMMLVIYDGKGINTILIVTNIICVVAGIAYALGARQAWCNPPRNASL